MRPTFRVWRMRERRLWRALVSVFIPSVEEVVMGSADVEAVSEGASSVEVWEVAGWRSTRLIGVLAIRLRKGVMFCVP